jgi:hypothetical protein
MSTLEFLFHAKFSKLISKDRKRIHYKFILCVIIFLFAAFACKFFY